MTNACPLQSNNHSVILKDNLINELLEYNRNYNLKKKSSYILRVSAVTEMVVSVYLCNPGSKTKSEYAVSFTNSFRHNTLNVCDFHVR
jgi:hypothetical protein